MPWATSHVGTLPRREGRPRSWRWIAATAGALVSASLLPAPAADAHPNWASAAAAVVAVIDTGINPYHVTFRDNSPRARRHPSTYIPGYPKNAKALRLSLNEPDYTRAVRRDCKRVWSKIKPGQLYWVPGTKIIGAITFEKRITKECQSNEAGTGRILDTVGHGTPVASRAASTKFGACRECLIVAAQITNRVGGDLVPPLRWAAKNAHWIDVQTNSWGPVLPLWEPTDSEVIRPTVGSPRLARAVEKAARKHLAFWASGNGTAGRGGVVGHPTFLDPRLTPSAIAVGGHDNGHVNLWPGFPAHVVADSCNAPVAHPNDTSKTSKGFLGTGTSIASPYAAGGAARILLKARRILGDTATGVRNGVVARGPRGTVRKGPLADGKLTLAEWKLLTFKTATARPGPGPHDGRFCGPGQGLVLWGSTPVHWKELPGAYPEYVHIGYGAIDDRAFRRAGRVLRGHQTMPDRANTDQFFALDAQVRAGLHALYRGGLPG